VKLYKNYLPKVKGKFISRTYNQKTLRILMRWFISYEDATAATIVFALLW